MVAARRDFVLDILDVRALGRRPRSVALAPRGTLGFSAAGRTSATLSADGALAALGFEDGSVRIQRVDVGGAAVSTSAEVSLQGGSAKVVSLGFSPDSAALAAASEDGGVHDLASGAS